MKLRHIWSALQKNYGVKVIVDFAKVTGSAVPELHAVVVEEILGTTAGGRSTITGVRLYDSNIGRLNRVLARDWADGGILTLVKFAAGS